MQGIYSRVRVERVRGEITEASTGSRFDGWDRERYETHARNASCRLFGPLDPRLLRQAQLDSSQRRRPIGRRDFANRYHLPAARMLKCHGHLPIWRAVHQPCCLASGELYQKEVQSRAKHPAANNRRLSETISR